jgi:hypothetical protein
MCAARDDAFAYLTVPIRWWEDEEQQAFWDGQKYRDRVTLIPTDTQTTDRMTELLKFPAEISDLVSPTSAKCWDADTVITTRIPQLMNYRGMSSRYVSFEKGTYRSVIGLDDMPMLSFRKTVAWGNTGEFDRHTIAQYMGADHVVLSDMWTKKQLLQLARQYYTPSNVMELDKQVDEALPVRLKELALRKKPEVKDVLNVVFAGRMTGTRNFTEVADVLRKQYSYPLGKGPMRFIISTQSQSIGSINAGELDFFEMQHNNREQFHKLMKEEAHVVVNLSTVEDFSLSTYEPMMLGVPVVVPNRPWADFLGPDYPFRADNFVQAYAIISEMAKNYEEMYEKFRVWHESWWTKLVASDKNRATAAVVFDRATAHKERVLEYVSEREIGGAYRGIASEIIATQKGDLDIPKYMAEKGLFETDKDWRKTPVSKRPLLFLMKILLELHGAKDTGTCGVMRLPK